MLDRCGKSLVSSTQPNVVLAGSVVSEQMLVYLRDLVSKWTSVDRLGWFSRGVGQSLVLFVALHCMSVARFQTRFTYKKSYTGWCVYVTGYGSFSTTLRYPKELRGDVVGDESP